ncbi:anti-sigma factor [Jiangella gansuensis]|uniref:anti-sigma factor n=1 Tax=Jiangella gansuensis TaxID=281473 RepID=UPI0004B5A682|nr:anti-sigma factor [Jiangella gansuensis]
MTRHEDADIHTLAAPYAVHALPPEEARRFEAHLDRCPDCRTEVAELRETAARLGSAAAVVPPARMRQDVMSRIAQVRPLPPVEQAAGRSDGALNGDARPGALLPDDGNVSAIRRWWPKVATGLVAALLAGIVALGVRLDTVQDELDRSEQIGAQMRQLVEAEDMEMVRVGDGGSRGTVLVARSLDLAVFVGDGMAPAPEDHTYQLWLMHEDGVVVSAGVLGSPPDGHVGPVTARGLAGVERMGITIEPDGGSSEPTSDPVMMIELPA